MFEAVDPAREEAEDSHEQGQVERVGYQGEVAGLALLRYAVGYEAEGGGFFAGRGGEVGVEFGDVGEGVFVGCWGVGVGWFGGEGERGGRGEGADGAAHAGWCGHGAGGWGGVEAEVGSEGGEEGWFSLNKSWLVWDSSLGR